MFDDAALIASKLTTLADEGKDIVLVMSSYGGFPGTEAAFGLSKAARKKNGSQGGIISLVYIAAHIPQIGQCTSDFGDGTLPKDEYMSVEYSPEVASAVFSDLSDSKEQKQYFDMMRNHSRVSFDGKLKHEGWKEVKSYYLHTKQDNIIRPDVQLRQIKNAKDQGADLEVIEIDSGHIPMLGRESEVCELLVNAAVGAWTRQER